MKILYLNSYKWLLSQNQRIRNDFFGNRRYKALAKYIKPFLENIEVKGRQCPDYRSLIRISELGWKVPVSSEGGGI